MRLKMPARRPPPPPRLLLLLLLLPLLLDPDSSSLTSVTTTLSESFESSMIVSASDEGEEEMSNCGAARIAAMEAASASRISDLFKLDLIVTDCSVGDWSCSVASSAGWMQVFFCSSPTLMWQGTLLLVLC